MGNVNLVTIFLTGLLTGGLTCMAVQGGLLAATIAQREEERLKEETKKGNALPIIIFLAAKLVAYTILGAFLGYFGSFFQMSLTTQVIMQFAIAIFMIGMALNILEVHPIFRYFVIQPPRFLTRYVRKRSKSKDIFAPAILGALTIFIPCGTTQAMMALAIASGSAVVGALILFAFIIGTSPVFFILGYFTTKLSERLHMTFMRFAAYAIILLALFNVNNALALSGFTGFTDMWCTFTICNTSKSSGQVVSQEALEQTTITMDDYQGYVPNQLTAKAGSTVTLHLKNDKARGCIQSFTIPSLGIQKVVPQGTSQDITFTVPTNTSEIPFMCGMGMYRGVIKII